MHAHQYARSREERAEDGQGEGRDGEREVPDPKESTTVLDDDRVDVGGRGQPRQQRRVLDGVPAPESAPAEYLVAPPRPEHDAEGERTPGEHRPTPLLQGPALLHSTGHEHRNGEGEGDAEAHKSQIEQRRVYRNQGIVL